MRIIFKLAISNFKKNPMRSLLTLLGVILSVSLITLVGGIAFSAIDYVGSSGFDTDTVNAIMRVGICFTVITAFFGCMMIYSAFVISFDGRVKTIGLLTSIGMSRWQKSAMVLMEAAVYALVGNLAGVTLGNVLAKLFYENGASIILAHSETEIGMYVVTPAGILISAGLGTLATFTASFVPMLRIRRITVMDSIHGRTKINISLRQGLLSGITETLFGRLGKLAGQNYDNNKEKYRAISLSLSGGTTLFFAVYTFFKYPIRYDAEQGYSPNSVLISLFRLAIVFAVLLVLISLVCASGSAAVNINRRRHEFAMLKSIGMRNSEICKMMCIECIFLVYYCIIYGLVGSLLADWLICSLFRITDEPLLKFWYPVPVVLAFVLLDIVVGLLLAVYSVAKVRKINIIEAIRNK